MHTASEHGCSLRTVPEPLVPACELLCMQLVQRIGPGFSVFLFVCAMSCKSGSAFSAHTQPQAQQRWNHRMVESW